MKVTESDFEAFAKRYGHFTKILCGTCHDRFIIVDQKEIFVIGASLKDAARRTRTFVFCEMTKGILSVAFAFLLVWVAPWGMNAAPLSILKSI